MRYFLGTDVNPRSVMPGKVMQVTNLAPPFVLEETGLLVRFFDVYAGGPVVSPGYIQPFTGYVNELFIAGKLIELDSTDISSGCVLTKNYGAIPIGFIFNNEYEYGLILMTPEQVEQFK